MSAKGMTYKTPPTKKSKEGSMTPNAKKTLKSIKASKKQSLASPNIFVGYTAETIESPYSGQMPVEKGSKEKKKGNHAKILRDSYGNYLNEFGHVVEKPIFDTKLKKSTDNPFGNKPILANEPFYTTRRKLLPINSQDRKNKTARYKLYTTEKKRKEKK